MKQIDVRRASGVVGAVALAGASQAYGQIINVEPPTNIPGHAPNSGTSTAEYWAIQDGNGTTSATPTSGSDLEFGYLNSSTYNESFTGVYGLNGGKSLAYAGRYADYAYALPKATVIGTGGPFAFNQTNNFTFLALTYNGNVYSYQKPNTVTYLGFEFTATDGLLHDGWLELESVSTDGSTLNGGLDFIAAAYNSVPDEDGGTITAGEMGINAVPEPGTLSALAFGAAGLGGIGWRRRRRAALRAEQVA